jgi:hypothetical protein
LTISPGATLSVDASAGPAVVYVRSTFTDLGQVTEPRGGGTGTLFVYLGCLPVGVPAPFQGSFVAPSALLTVGPGNVSGAFYAQDLTVVTGTTVTARPFAGWATVGACFALTAAEKTAASQLGLDPSRLYPVAGNERQIVLPVAAGKAVTLGLRYESGTGPEDSAARFRVLSLDSGTVLGGSTFVVRRR